MKRLLVNCNFGNDPHNSTIRTDAAIIVELEDDEMDIALLVMNKLISLNYDVYDNIKYFKKSARFTSQLM